MQTRLKFLIILSALMILSSPALAFDFGRQVGIVEITEGKICLAISNPSLKEKEPVNIITPDEPQEIIKVNVEKKLSRSCFKIEEMAPGGSFYSLKVEKADSKISAAAVGIGITGYRGKFSEDATGIHADLNGDGVPESFRMCISSEGINLTIWSGLPLKTKRLWHEYYYLGYDLEPDCTEKDYAE